MKSCPAAVVLAGIQQTSWYSHGQVFYPDAGLSTRRHVDTHARARAHRNCNWPYVLYQETLGRISRLLNLQDDELPRMKNDTGPCVCPWLSRSVALLEEHGECHAPRLHDAIQYDVVLDDRHMLAFGAFSVSWCRCGDFLDFL